jgi:hypothetical protein
VQRVNGALETFTLSGLTRNVLYLTSNRAHKKRAESPFPHFCNLRPKLRGPRLLYLPLRWQVRWGPRTYAWHCTKVSKVRVWSTSNGVMVAIYGGIVRYMNKVSPPRPPRLRQSRWWRWEVRWEVQRIAWSLLFMEWWISFGLRILQVWWRLGPIRGFNGEDFGFGDLICKGMCMKTSRLSSSMSGQLH